MAAAKKRSTKSKQPAKPRVHIDLDDSEWDDEFRLEGELERAQAEANPQDPTTAILRQIEVLALRARGLAADPAFAPGLKVLEQVAWELLCLPPDRHEVRLQRESSWNKKLSVAECSCGTRYALDHHESCPSALTGDKRRQAIRERHSVALQKLQPLTPTDTQLLAFDDALHEAANTYNGFRVHGQEWSGTWPPTFTPQQDEDCVEVFRAKLNHHLRAGTTDDQILAALSVYRRAWAPGTEPGSKDGKRRRGAKPKGNRYSSVGDCNKALATLLFPVSGASRAREIGRQLERARANREALEV